MKIANKIRVFLVGLSALFCALAASTYIAEKKTLQRMEDISSLFSLSLDLNVPSVLVAQKLLRTIEGVESALPRILAGEQGDLLAEVVADLDAFARYLAQTRVSMRDATSGVDNVTLERQLQDYAIVADRFASFQAQVILVLEYHTGGRQIPAEMKAALRAYTAELQDILHMMRDAGEQDLARSRAQAGALIAETRQAQVHARNTAIVAAGVMVILAWFVAWLASRSVTVPLARMQRTVEAFSDGDWQTRVADVGTDEFGALANTLNTMADRLGTTTVSRDYVDSILQSLHGSVLVSDPAGTIESFNHASTGMLGVSWEGLFGRNVAEFVLQEDGEDTPDGTGTECLVRRADGTVLPVLYTRQVVVDDTGTPVRTVHVAEDISELVAVRQETDRLKEEFLAVVSHELRTPVTSILGSLKLIQSGAMGPLSTEMQDMLALAERNGDLLVERVNELLDMQKLQAGQMTLALVDADLGSLVQDVAGTMQGYADSHNIALAILVTPAPALVQCDPGRIKQVLTNLVSNAIKFSPDGAEVRIELLREADAFKILVHDAGPGIPPEMQARIFDKFQQASGAVSRVKGTGLGLAIAREIVELHQGEIHFDSSPRGTTFWFTLPAVA